MSTVPKAIDRKLPFQYLGIGHKARIVLQIRAAPARVMSPKTLNEVNSLKTHNEVNNPKLHHEGNSSTSDRDDPTRSMTPSRGNDTIATRNLTNSNIAVPTNVQ